MSLGEEQIERYSRQIILPEIGGRGQEKLLASKVLLVGAGGLGSPAGLYLAAAGVGAILVGESLMRQPNIGAAVDCLLRGERSESG